MTISRQKIIWTNITNNDDLISPSKNFGKINAELTDALMVKLQNSNILENLTNCEMVNLLKCNAIANCHIVEMQYDKLLK